MVSPPALISATTRAFEACACSRNDEKSWLLIGARTPPTTTPPAFSTTRRTSRGARRQSIGVAGPVNNARRTGLSGEVRRRGAGDQEYAILLLYDAAGGERHSQVRRADHGVGANGVYPCGPRRRYCNRSSVRLMGCPL